MRRKHFAVKRMKCFGGVTIRHSEGRSGRSGSTFISWVFHPLAIRRMAYGYS